jgi:hypothetical protein
MLREEYRLSLCITKITALGLKSRSKDLFWLRDVDLKKKRVGYPSVMDFKGRFASGPYDIFYFYPL